MEDTTEGEREGQFRWGRNRGASPMVGIVLLFAMVAVGAILLFVVGVPMLEALEAQSERERAHLCMEQADNQLATVMASGERQAMPSAADSDCRLGVAGDGQFEVVWYNESEHGGDPDDLPWDDADRTASAGLGALEFDLGDRTIAYQGGGIWEDTGTQTHVMSEPDLGYDGSVQFDVVVLDEDELDGSDPVARPDHDETAELAAEIEAAAASSDGEHVALRIESSYYDGWERHLEAAFGADRDENVDVTSDSTTETVTVTIEEVRDTVAPDGVVVAEDYGLQGEAVDNRIVHPDYWEEGSPNPLLEVKAEFENLGDEDVVGHQVGLEIVGEDVSNPANSTVNLDGGDSESKTLGIPPGNDLRELAPGETYEYDVTTEDDSLDDYGSFYLAKSGTHFEVVELEETESEEGEYVTIAATVENQGIESGARDVAIDFPDLNVSVVEEDVELESAATGTVEWTLNKSALPAGSNAFAVETGDDTANGTIDGQAVGDERGFVVVSDEGAGDDQIVEDDGTPFTVGATVVNTYAGTETRDVTLTIPDANVEMSEPVTLDGTESDVVDFAVDPDDYDFDHGSVYEYDVRAEGDGLTENGSFYVGHPGTEFELSNGNATADGEYVTITADLHNTGVEDGIDEDAQDVTLELDYQGDDLPDDVDEDVYAEPIDAGTVERSFGENGTVELPINQSVLVSGPYDATIATEDDDLEVSFTVDAGVDPGEVGLGDIEDANVTVDVLGSQVSADADHHYLAPMTLEVVTNGETEHAFENPIGGDNINTGPTWQDKSADSYTYNFTVEDETELTLRNTRYELCQAETTDPNALAHYDGPTDRDFAWCKDVPNGWWSVEFGPIDASQDANLQNVRVRSNESNTIPALPAGTDQQLSATEVLEQHGLAEDGDDELDLGPGEFVFLFENTESTDEDGIDALWNEAIDAYENNPDETYDPNFNDLIVYVEVERAGVDPGTPSITIDPAPSEEPEVDPGEGGDAGDVGDTDLEIEGDSDDGDAPDVGTGDSSAGGTGSESGETGVEIDSDHIVIE